MSRKRILLYNWVQFDDEERRGGGVTVYLYDLIRKLSEDSEIQCVFLSSGLEYTFDGKLRIERTQNCFSERVDTFKIINSPVHAPACMQFSELETYLYDTSLYKLFDNFWNEQGGFDVVHFHNLEGLSLSVLKLKEAYPQTKFLLSLHNYFLFCPQVNLWTNSYKNCYREPQFPYCCHCLPTSKPKLEGIISSAKSALKHIPFMTRDAKLYKLFKQTANFLRNSNAKRDDGSEATADKTTDSCKIFLDYRKENVYCVNKYIDEVLAVSQQTADIAQSYGIYANKIRTDYIGTTAASKRRNPKSIDKEIINLAFLGYAREDKGFYMFLEALEQIPPKAASKLNVILAAKCDSAEQYHKYDAYVESLMKKFNSYIFVNGYKKRDQSKILDKVDIGIIPSMWEDNLPQVAIEYIAYGIPIISSDAGGAKELCKNPWFVYPSGDSEALSKKIEEIAVTPKRILSFWDNIPELTTIEEHVANLKCHYLNQKQN